jgi:hypothetical protein
MRSVFAASFTAFITTAAQGPEFVRGPIGQRRMRTPMVVILVSQAA